MLWMWILFVYGRNTTLMKRKARVIKTTYLWKVVMFVFIRQSVNNKLQKFLDCGWKTLNVMGDCFKDTKHAKLFTC